MPSFVLPPQGITASFSAPAKRSNSAISSAEPAITAAAGRMPSTSYAASEAVSTITFAGPNFAAIRAAMEARVSLSRCADEADESFEADVAE
jgi:hypothetical protein